MIEEVIQVAEGELRLARELLENKVYVVAVSQVTFTQVLTSY